MSASPNNAHRNKKLPLWIERSLLAVILLTYLIAGLMYAFLTPVFEASDELWHYPMVHHLADGNPLPVQTYNPAEAGPWKQEASQPPLYYYVGAALTFWVDRSDFDDARDLNPHVDTGKLTTDGNINLAVRDPFANELAGTLLAVKIIRVFSVGLGVITVILTYIIASRVTPNRSDIPLLATALNAFTPMFVFITGSVNNDNLAIPLASLGLVLLIELMQWAISFYPALRGANDPSLKLFERGLLIRALGVGSVVGLAVLTKQGTIGLIPLAWGTFFLVGWQSSLADYSAPKEQFITLIKQIGTALFRSLIWFVIFFIPIVLIAGWWYYRNIQLYGDLLGWSAFEAVLGVRETPASLAQLWDERWGFMLSYWGLFGGLNVEMPDWIYRTMTAVLIVAVPGGIWFVIQEVRSSLWWRFAFRPGNSPADTLTSLLNLVVSKFPLVVSILFSFAIVYGLTQWATQTWSSQGRLVFTAISPLNILMAAGLATIFEFPLIRQVKTVIAVFFAAVTLAAPLVFIAPRYEPPSVVNNGIDDPWIARIDTESAEEEDWIVFNGRMRLVAAQINSEKQFFQPGDTIPLATEWRIQGRPDTDWSIFVHLIDPVLGIPVAQRDMYPGQGLVATTKTVPNQVIPSRFDLNLSDTLVAPAELDLRIGVYNFETGERATLKDGSDSLLIGTIQVAPKTGETPNPISINFENQFELIGFEVADPRVASDASVEVTAFWKLLEDTTQDYTFFAQVVGEDTTRWQAVDLAQPTSTWEVGTIQAIPMTLNIVEEAPAGVYPLRMGVYERDENDGFRNLQRITPDGRLTDDFINLTLIRIDTEPDE